MNNILPTDYQNFIAVSRYARWLDDEGRRETWNETVSRYIDYMDNKVKFSKEDKHDIEQAILGLEVMPSMRALMTAGKALDRDNTAGYNCSYLPVDDPKAFDEAMYILLCGTGVGFSVERQYVGQLPDIPEVLEHVVGLNKWMSKAYPKSNQGSIKTHFKLESINEEELIL